MADKGVLGGSVPCQSQSQTVPKDPSPTSLSGVYDRVEPANRGNGDQLGKTYRGDDEGDRREQESIY